MGDAKRLAGHVVALVGIVGSLFLPWWGIARGGATVEITLRHVEACQGSVCASVSTGGLFGTVAFMTFGVGCLAVLAVLAGGVWPILQGQSSRAMVPAACAIYLVMVAVTALSLPSPLDLVGLDRELGFWGAIFGPLAGLALPIAGLAARPRPHAAPAVAPSLPTAVARPVEPVRAIEPAVGRPARASVAPVRVLRFAAEAAELREDALVVVAANGARRELRWSDLGGALARDLADPATALVDLIPRGAPPARILAETRLTLAAGAPAADAHDRLRQVLAFARAMHPALELEDATADFVYKRVALPSWTRDEVERYDARYA